MRVPVSGPLLAPRSRPRVIWYQEVESESKPGTWYAVSGLSDGTLICDCPDYRCRRAAIGEDCKHITQVKGRMIRKEAP